MKIFDTIFLPALVSFVLTFAGVLLALRFFPLLRFLDRPEKYGLKRKPIPYSGGLVIFLAFIVSALVFIDIDKKMLGLIVGALLITFVSFWDDRFSLSPWVRLAVQILAGIIVVLAGVKMQLLTNPFGGPFMLDQIKFTFAGQEIWLFSAIFIIIWLVLMMNVMNWLDGIPSLASGVGIIASLVMFILSIQGFHVVDQTTIMILSASLFFSLLAFWIFDFPPPRLLMGDTGSMLLGFLLGMFAIFSGGKIATALLIMGFPVLDSIWVVMRRIIRGKSPVRGDYSHLHHRLLRVGLSEKKALFLNYALCGGFGAIALLLDNAREKLIALLILSVIMIVTAGIVIFFENK